ncbi:hypothetical protein BCV70DRAFT_197857 [Testicularia cyperi]|uniref:TBP-associated factor 6 n=1 Tax=Testicularia cyperi TaxID=1882483 RepID=A0A317XZE3_9BASI|nr:hypothetical protein BCV70DRAFT_197857 [Testicularia cyperi]
MAPSSKAGAGLGAPAGPSSSSSNGAALGLGLSGSAAGPSSGGIGLGPLAGVPSSVYPTDTIKDVAESLGIVGMKDSVAAALAADVEYRIREIVQDAAKYMRHSKRDQLKTTDVDAALRARNVEPLYGFMSTSLGRSGGPSSRMTAGPTFRRVQSASGVPLHYVEDEEIDFDKILEAGPKIGIGRGVGWGAHWLAIEGVQPAVPQNPSPVAVAEANTTSMFRGPTSTQASASVTAAKAVTVAGGDGQAIAKPLVKHILSRELQLYYERLTKAIVNPPPEADEDLDEEPEPEPESEPAPPAAAAKSGDEDVQMESAASPRDSNAILTPPRPTISLPKPLKSFAQKGFGNHVRDAALASLRGDPGLHQLVPYLIQFVGSKVIETLRAPAHMLGGESIGDAVPSGAPEATAETTKTITMADNHMLSVMLGALHAILINPHIFVEPYLHQMMPSLLSILLTASLAESNAPGLGPSNDRSGSALITAGPSAYALRAHAAALLVHIVDSYGASYPTLKPRVVATLLKALMSGTGQEASAGGADSTAVSKQSPASAGTKLGAVMALRRLGKASFRVLLSEPQGPASDLSASGHSPLYQLGSWLSRPESGSARQINAIVNEIASGLDALLPAFLPPNSATQGSEHERLELLQQKFGEFWSRRVIQRDQRARIALEIEIGMRTSSSSSTSTSNGPAAATAAPAETEAKTGASNPVTKPEP